MLLPLCWRRRLSNPLPRRRCHRSLRHSRRRSLQRLRLYRGKILCSHLDLSLEIRGDPPKSDGVAEDAVK
uniref:Uncharacterized protein n=1 Tax=Rhizophora mucronata TaxID=61149 RepID=A0A2P2PLD0_RHIMU